MSTAKEQYIAFIRENYVPLFYRDIYLDAVCDHGWDVLIYQENGQIIAAYIYMIKQKFGIKYIIQPQLCPYTGPIFFQLTNLNQAYSYFLQNIPNHQLVIQDYFHSIPNIAEDKFTSSKKHTYIINKTVDIDELWQQQSSTHRRIIRKAERELNYEEVENIDVFLEFVSKTFKKRGKFNPNDSDIFQKLDGILNENGLRKIVKCTNETNVTVAMCYFMYDEQWTYNFANSVIEDYKHYGMNLILWNEIKSSLAGGRSFDFEGSMIPGIDAFFKRFKGTQTFYQSRYKSSNRLIDYLVNIKKAKTTK